MRIFSKPSSRLAGLVLLTILVLNACTNSPPDANTSLSQETGTVSQIMYVDTYETTGAIAPLNRSAVKWNVIGEILEVYVEPGQMVKCGDVLMTIDPNTTNLANVEREVENTRTALQALIMPDTATIIATNRMLAAAYTTWYQAWNDLNNLIGRYAYSGDFELYIAWRNAEITMSEALNALPLANASIDVQVAFQAARAASLHQAANEQAEIALAAAPDDLSVQQRAAEVTASWQKAQSEAETRRALLSEDEKTRLITLLDALAYYEQAVNAFVASFEGEVAFENAVKVNVLMAAYQDAGAKLGSAVLNLYVLVRQPDPDAYAAAMERLETAEQNLNDLQKALVLIAPMDGQVIAVNFKPGDTADPKIIAIEVMDRKNLSLSFYVEEARVIKLKVGDPVEISLEVMPDVQLKGQVAYVSPTGANNQGVVYYQVRVDIEQTEVDVLIGATADIVIQLGEPRQVIVVPVAAVQNDAQGEYVLRVSGGEYERVAVVSGLILDDNTVVVDGNLSVGDTLALFTSVTPANQNQRIPGIFR